jgi:hypothetical protein
MTSAPRKAERQVPNMYGRRTTPTSFTCQRCWNTSHNPNDARERYCGQCRMFFRADGTEEGTE